MQKGMLRSASQPLTSLLLSNGQVWALRLIHSSCRQEASGTTTLLTTHVNTFHMTEKTPKTNSGYLFLHRQSLVLFLNLWIRFRNNFIK